MLEPDAVTIRPEMDNLQAAQTTVDREPRVGVRSSQGTRCCTGTPDDLAAVICDGEHEAWLGNGLPLR